MGGDCLYVELCVYLTTCSLITLEKTSRIVNVASTLPMALFVVVNKLETNRHPSTGDMFWCSHRRGYITAAKMN